MPRRVALTVDDCQRLKAIVDSLDTQSGIAKSANLGQPWLSYVLRGERNQKVDSAKLNILATELARRVRRELAARELSDEQASAALSFLGRFTPTAAALQPEVHSPGGPVPPDVPPYVKRNDADLSEALKEWPFYLLFLGPQQSGKSTAIARLERRAQQLGYETAWVDPQTALNVIPAAGDDGDVDAALAAAISELLQIKWGLRRPESGILDPIGKINNWLVSQLGSMPPKPRLLILDDLCHLGHKAAGRWIGRFARHIMNSGSIRLSIAVGLTHQYGSNFSAQLLLNSSLNWSARINVEWFSRKEVETLIKALQAAEARVVGDEFSANSEPDLTDSVRRKATKQKGRMLATKDQKTAAKDLWETFRGQPYLTHAGAVHDTFLGAVQGWMSEPSDKKAAELLRSQPWYRRHLAATRLALFGPMYKPADDDAKQLLTAFLQACERFAPTKHEAGLDPDQEDFLLRSGLLNKTGLPALEIYRLFAEDLKAIAQ